MKFLILFFNFKDIGDFLRSRIIKHCKDNKVEVTLKYIDPAYMIRTVPANSYDKKLCRYFLKKNLKLINEVNWLTMQLMV